MNLKSEKITVTDLDRETGGGEITGQIRKGLMSEEKYLPSKLFYDDAGSELFEEITRLDEYYPPRLEAGLLRRVAAEKNSGFENRDIVELGSGDCSKISIFLGAMPVEARKTLRYVPVDISRGAIEKSANLLSEKFPGLRIHCMPADFTRHLDRVPRGRKRVFFFLGGTIGNLSEKEARGFMKNMDCVMEEGDILIAGMDMVKDVAVLEKAYNDSRGVTARFNRNILRVVNRHMKGNFDPGDFEHLAYFNNEKQRIEMHLRAESSFVFKSPFMEKDIVFSAGETIHTENSRKFTFAGIEELGAGAGLELRHVFTDEKKWFSLAEFGKRGARWI